MVLIRALKPAIQYLETVALTPGYENDDILVAEKPKQEFTDEDWEKVADSEKPLIRVVDADLMRQEVKNQKRWRKFLENGEACDTDSSDDEEV